jgi:hypothetical protein
MRSQGCQRRTLLGTQNTRPTTIEMTENPEVEDDGVLRRDRPRALRARRGLLFRHRRSPNAKGTVAPGARRQLASPRCSDGRRAER